MKVLSISATILVLFTGAQGFADFVSKEFHDKCSKIAIDQQRYDEMISKGLTSDEAEVNSRKTVFIPRTFNYLVASGSDFEEAEQQSYDWEYTDYSDACMKYRHKMRGGH